MKWTKEQPKEDGLYWCRCSGYGKLFPHGEGETDIICDVSYSDPDKDWEIIELGGDCFFGINDELGVLFWSDVPVQRPEETEESKKVRG